MTRTLYTLISLLFPALLFSQILVEENKEWYIQDLGIFTGNINTFRLKLEGDTTIDANTYKKVWRSNSESGDDWIQLGEYLREEQEVVYHYAGNTEQVMFDFTVQENDTVDFDLELTCEMVVDSISEVELLDGSLRTSYTFRTVVDFGIPRYFTWIEGVGSTAWGPLTSLFSYCATDNPYSVNCYLNNGELLYGANEIGDCFVVNAEEKLVQPAAVQLTTNTTGGLLGFEFREGQAGNCRFELFSPGGQFIWSTQVPAVGYQEVLLPHHLPEGIYFFRLIKQSEIIFAAKTIRIN